MSEALPSGLPDSVADDEDLARILKSSSLFTSTVVKASAFVPAKDGTTSVIRHGPAPDPVLRKLAEQFLGGQARVYGVAICKALVIRQEHLDVVAEEPPPRHANVVGWPTHADPELQKARQKEVALAIASQCMLIKLQPQVTGS